MKKHLSSPLANGHHSRMVTLKPYTCRTQCRPSISDPPLPFPTSKININSRLHNSISFRLSHQPIICARRQGWSQSSNRKMLQLASTVAFNLKILPEPFNSLVGEIARGDSNGDRPEYRILNRLVGGCRGKLTMRRKRKGKKLVSLVFVLTCVAGLWSWRVSEFDLFLRSLLFCLVGVSSIRLWRGNKAIKDWFLGFFLGIIFMMSFGLGKEDVKFWVQKLRTCSPVAQIAMRNRNRNGRRRVSK